MLYYVQLLWSSWISVTTCYTMFSDCGHLRFWSPHATLCPVIVVILDFGHHMLHYVQWLWSSWISVTTCYTMSRDCGHHMLHYVQLLWSSWISVTTYYTTSSECDHLGFRSPHATLRPVIVAILDFGLHMLHYVQWLRSSSDSCETNVVKKYALKFLMFGKRM
jgi:hypothetical protein